MPGLDLPGTGGVNLADYGCSPRGRVPPPGVPDPVWYFACGSNMSERLFRERRHMTPIETRIGRLAGHRLCFTVAFLDGIEARE